MTKKFERLIGGPVFTEDGKVVNGGVGLMFNNGAALKINDTQPRLTHVRLEVPSLWFDKRTLEQLIAELLFLKEEWDNHPIVLEREQKEDMEEDNPFDEDDVEEEPEEPEEEINVRWVRIPR